MELAGDYDTCGRFVRIEVIAVTVVRYCLVTESALLLHEDEMQRK